MKKIKLTILLLLSLMIGFSILLIVNIKETEINNVIVDNQRYIYLKVKYDITLEEENILPVKVKNEENLSNSREFLQTSNLSYLNNLFEIDENNNLQKNNSIVFYPKDEINVIKTSRFKLDNDFFYTRGVSEKVSKKSAEIFLSLENSYDDCMIKLKKIYVGSKFNTDFYAKAIPKLIY
ncbi:hypothetical protein [Spiroplasma cantharicola]|uniref:Uncharacterized protein n=1 Tax=Spiroplasma cantharicola TaxID=362837 RepID=A0A0M4KCJ3_9MOLU|nr:hypothetical protein [Spiroplasma cantharicola]ALD66452.1 hypothetical protein SCANT_v1c05460 [Spiroplasma cantharicola]